MPRPAPARSRPAPCASARGSARTRTGAGWPASWACAGIEMDQERVSVSYGGTTVAAGGITIAHDEAAVAAHMAERHLEIVCDLGLGDGTFTVLTNDLTHEYIDENTGGS